MANRTLNAMEVGTMLVSTSCGIGFLLGTGELAVRQGMAGALYAVATALGLMLLAVFAPALCTRGQSVWNQFDQLYGRSVARNVALLSLIWMTGVLAAQIRGGSAVLALTGLSRTTSMLLIVVLLVALSQVSLSWLSAGFAFCLLACNLVLVDSLVRMRHFEVWLVAPMTFAEAIRYGAHAHTGFTLVSVALMVVCGADYQQFTIAAKNPSVARTGCLIAAAVVFALGFLPAAAVIAASLTGYRQDFGDPIQTVPLLLMRSVAGSTMGAVRNVVIIVLVVTALGSASSILRAMSDATAAICSSSIARPAWSRGLPLLLGTLVASRAQSLVDMMVDLNVVYIAAVIPLLVLSMLRIRVSDRVANATMAIACAISMTGYVLHWTAATSLPEATPPIASVVAALAVAGWYRTRVNSSSHYHLPGSRKINVGSLARSSVDNSPGRAGDENSG